MSSIYTCPHCSELQIHGRLHYCSELGKIHVNHKSDAQLLKQITEEDVRRIVREELEKRK